MLITPDQYGKPTKKTGAVGSRASTPSDASSPISSRAGAAPPSTRPSPTPFTSSSASNSVRSSPAPSSSQAQAPVQQLKQPPPPPIRVSSDPANPYVASSRPTPQQQQQSRPSPAQSRPTPPHGQGPGYNPQSAQGTPSAKAQQSTQLSQPPSPLSINTRPSPSLPPPAPPQPSAAASEYGQMSSGQLSIGADDMGVQEPDDIKGQALDILAGLTSLGISQALREKVQAAIQALDQASASAASAAAGARGSPTASLGPGGQDSQGWGRAGGKGHHRHGGGGGSFSESAERQVEALERKLAMSRNIMRKLYHKNVHLEKEVALLKADATPIASLDLLTGTPGARPATSAGAGPRLASDPVAQALQERDATILQLQHALDAARRRATLLESRLSGGIGPGAGEGAGRQALAAQQAGIREVLAQSALHLNKYQQIREDYNRLLYKRTSAVSTSKAASQHAKALVDEMQARLANEIQEREAEAALYSARLYESERQMSDWYVEKRMMQQTVDRLNEEIGQRDRIDSEIEACICSMFERLRMLEEANANLTAKLQAAGLADDSGVAEGQG